MASKNRDGCHSRALATTTLAITLAGLSSACAASPPVSQNSGVVQSPGALEPTRPGPESVVPKSTAKAPIIALIDSGLNPGQDPRFASRLVPRTQPSDLRDQSGHGTALARSMLDRCATCRILPISVTRGGADITPDRLARAIDRARQSGAQVINISLGLDQGSAALRRAIDAAIDASIPVVVAAGTGISNPFRPSSLDKLFPQSYPGVWVVNWVDPAGQPDPGSNFGPQILLSIAAKPSGEWTGSSVAAAELSAVLAQELGRMTRVPSVLKLREQLRALAIPPAGSSPEKVGRGVLTLSRLRLKQAD